MRRFVIFSLAVLLSILAIGNALDEIRKRGVLRVGQGAGAYIPLHMTTPEGDRVGFNVDLAKAIANALGVKLELVLVKWEGIIPALVSGDFDMIISGMTITPERALKVDFSIPYLTIGQTVLYSPRRFDHPPTYEELKKIKGLKITVELGTTGEFAARRMFPDAEILTYDDLDEAAFQVARGKADIMVVDSIYAIAMAKKYPSLECTGELLTREDLGIAVRKGKLELLHWLNTFLRWARTSGLIDRLKEKWGVEAE